jgi:thymidylate synthase
MNPDRVYADLIHDVVARGDALDTRNAPARRLFARTAVFRSTPLVRARRTAWRCALREMEWFLSGSNRLDDLHPSVRHWWAPWADAEGRVANNYSVQLRRSAGRGGEVDQVAALLSGVRDHPYSRRNVITTWNTADMLAPETRITNCHGSIIQAFVDGPGALHLVTYQRSADVVCGLPHNWVQYWALLLWLASSAGHAPGSLTWFGGDVHVYECHLPLARGIVRAADGLSGPGPQLLHTPSGPDFRAADFRLDGPYEPVLAARAEMVV